MRRRMAGAVIAGLLVAGCGSSEDGLDRPPGLFDEESVDELVEDLAALVDDEEGDDAGLSSPGPDDGRNEPDDSDLPPLDSADFPPVAGRTIDAVVAYGMIEWEVQEMVVVDLDADLEAGRTPQGVEITFPTRVYNAGSGTAMVTSTPIALQWDDPVTGDTFTVAAQLDFREVPAESFSSGEVTVRLSAEDRRLYDDDSAYLLVGRTGLSPAVVPIGSGVELVDRLPVVQDTDGWELSIEGVDSARRAIDDTVTVTAAEIRWTGPEGRPLDDGDVLLEITYTIDNRGEAQTCSQRSEGGWRLTLPDGDAVSDLRVSERCAGRGQTVTGVLTGFYLPSEDFAGEYQLLHRRGSGGSDDPHDEISITLSAGDGVRLSELRD